jgi:predicted ATPase
MPLFSIEVEGYRAFRDKAKVDIHPLTLLYGENQAGKSTLLRLLVLLADSLYSGRGPLNLNSSAVKGESFENLGWQGVSNDSSKPSFSLIARDGVSLTLKFGEERDFVFVDRLSCKSENTVFNSSVADDVHRVSEHVSALYAGKHEGHGWSGDLNFKNLIPTGFPEKIEKIVQDIQSDLSKLKYIQWLGVNRIIDGRGDDRGAARCCSADASDLISFITGDLERSILNSASTWFREQGLGDSIEIQSGKFAIKSKWGVRELPVSLAGEGIRSLLPILLCAVWAEKKQEKSPSFLAIEEPESHLHPTLQVSLFDRLLETVKSGIPVVLETHSVYMLRAMQLAVLDGRLSPDDVGLYWVGQKEKSSASFVEKIMIENDARLSGWPLGTFETEQELSYEIMDLRWKKGTDS